MFVMIASCAATPALALRTHEADAGNLRVAMRMPLGDLRAGSTYPIAGRADEALGMFTVREPHSLTFVDGGRELHFSNLGEDQAFSSVLGSEGRVVSMNVQPFPQEVSLDEALAKGRELYDWFLSAGFEVNEPGIGFHDNSVRSTVATESIQSFDDARTVLVDPSAQVTDATLFNMSKGGVYMSVTIYNSRRMQEAYDRPRPPEGSGAASERRWSLEVGVASLDPQ